MYSITQPPTMQGISGTPQSSNLWLWLGIGLGAYLLFKKPKRKTPERQESQTPADLHGLEFGYMRTALDKEEKRIQKEILSYLYLDYNPLDHDKYMKRYNKAVESGKQKDFMESRNLNRKQPTLFGLSGNLRTCDAWFETTDKRGRMVHRCFIYKPSCNTKKCKADTAMSGLGKTTTSYQDEFPFLQFKKRPNGKYIPVFIGTNQAYEIEDTPINYEFDSPKLGYRYMLYKLKPKLETLASRKRTAPEQSEMFNPSQMTLFGKLSGLGWTKDSKIDLAPLAEEAKNYSNSEEFANSFLGRGGRMMSPTGEYHSDRINRLSQIYDEYNPKLAEFIEQYPYEAKKIPGLNRLTGNEKTVTIYRSATGDIRPGDWVALSGEYAKGHSRTKTHKLYKMQVPISDLRWAGTSAEEWFYAPQSAIKEFKDFDPKKFYDDVIKGKLKGLAGYTATCRTFKKNSQGRRYCAKYAPTCKSATDDCRDFPPPVPGTLGKRTKKDVEEEANAIAQMLADEANDDLKRNKELMREVLKYGGIAPHKGGFLKEEYSELPDKYKRKAGIPLDELAQEMGMDEGELTDRIYSAEAQFKDLKEMRGGKLAKKFSKDDFMIEAWDRMNTGRGFLGNIGKLGPGQCTTITAGPGGSPEGTLMVGCNMPGGFRILGKKGLSGLGTSKKNIWELTPDELTQLDFDVPEGGASKTPKTVFDWKKEGEEYETLYSMITGGDKYIADEILGKHYHDVPNTLALIPKIKADKPLKVYRAVEKGFDSYIIPGAYVTESRAYAKAHGENILEGNYQLIESEVKPSELMSYGDAHEFIYIPENPEIAIKRLRESAKVKGDLKGINKILTSFNMSPKQLKNIMKIGA